MVRKKPVSARIDHQTYDALERFSDVYDYTRSEALAALATDSLKQRGYLDEREDPLEGVSTLSQRVIAHTFDLALLVGITLLADAGSSLLGRPIEILPPREILITLGVVLVGLNLLTQYSRRKRLPGLIREIFLRSQHRLRRRAGRLLRE